MTEWITSLPGTSLGTQLAIGLASMSAIAHAFFGSMQKGKVDPWISRGAFDAWMFILAAPVALFVVPWPDRTLAWILAGALVIRFFYKLTMTMAYQRAAYTVVYPVVRGTSPLVAVIFAIFAFDEHYSVMQWAGIACLSGGILLLSVVNITATKEARGAIYAGIGTAFVCGVIVALYTTWDAYGIRTAADPFTFLAGFFFVTAVDFPVISWICYRRMENPPPLGPLLVNGFFGALVAFISFGGVMLSSYLGKVGQAAVLRETSTVFAALIGWLILKETVGVKRTALMVLIAAGAIIVQFG